MLGTDETPAPLTGAATSAEGCGNPHVYTVRTMHARLYRRRAGPPSGTAPPGNRKKPSIAGFGILDGYCGVLVRDDYGGYLSYDAGLAGVQQCLAHLYRYLDDAYAIDPASRVWSGQAGDALREAAAAVRTARDARQASLDPVLLARLRHSYDQAVAVGISVNLSRPWHKGKHPGLILARRLKRKAAQVWLFANRLDIPGHEQRIRERRPRLQARREDQRLLAHPGHPAAPLPHPLLPHHRPQPRPPPPRRHPRRPHRRRLDATAPSMIN